MVRAEIASAAYLSEADGNYVLAVRGAEVRGSNPLGSTKRTLHEHLLFQRRLCYVGVAVMSTTETEDQGIKPLPSVFIDLPNPVFRAFLQVVLWHLQQEATTQQIFCKNANMLVQVR